MNTLIAKLLERAGIKDTKDLSEDERRDYDQWQEILSKEEFTMEDMKKFLAAQIEVIENKWSDYTMEEDKKSRLLPYHTVYRTLLKAIGSPRSEREALEKYLNQLLQK